LKQSPQFLAYVSLPS
jgi:hypothetical protein